MFFLLPFLNIGIICIQKKKKREKLKGFCCMNSKLVNGLCYIRQPSDLGFFQVKEKRKKKRGERRKGLLNSVVVGPISSGGDHGVHC